MKTIAFVFGTRPEAIKLAPLILEAKKNKHFQVIVCLTGQHKQMISPILKGFDIRPDIDLEIMLPNQSLSQITSRSLNALDKLLEQRKPDIVIVQGDTTTVLAASLAAFYHKVPVAHVEAGLRTFDKYSPWPEEINRSMVSRIAKWHFAPTERNQQNLVKEGISEEDIYITGNTVIDALFLAIQKIKEQPKLISSLEAKVKGLVDKGMDYVLITGHRRENFGVGFEQICEAIQALASTFSGIHFIYPVHLNPRVQEPVKRLLGKQENIHLVPPMDYFTFIYTMQHSRLILTDSGGIQEEAPSLGKPVLVMRENTERPEALSSGSVELVGTDKSKIIASASKYLVVENQILSTKNPYGDGQAADRILQILSSDN